MPIDRKAVDHVARLARLDLDENERGRMEEELASILAHVERIQALDLDPVEPTTHALPLKNVARPDVAGECLSQADALANAPAPESGRFSVPRILEAD